MAETNVMEQLVSLCKRRGFIYPASEIYGGLNGFWDYGPLGVLLKNNIRDWWWRNMVITPPIGPDGHPVDIVGLDSSIIQHPKTWVASGHVGGFSDPMVDDRETKQRFRADHLIGFYKLFELPPGEAGQIKLKAIEEYHNQMADPNASRLPARTVVASSRGEAISTLENDKKLRKEFGI